MQVNIMAKWGDKHMLKVSKRRGKESISLINLVHLATLLILV